MGLGVVGYAADMEGDDDCDGDCNGMSVTPYFLRSQDTLCFVHVPKTAGTTLISLLDAKFHHSDICPAQLWSHVAIAPFLSSDYRLIRGHFTWDDYAQYVSSPVYIAMVRDPVQRTISEYNFMNDYPDSWKNQQQHLEAVYDFDPQAGAAVETRIKLQQRAIALDLDQFVRDPFVQTAIGNSHLRAFATSTTQPSQLSLAEQLDLARQRLQDLAFVGVVEDFQTSMALLAYTFGWHPIGQYQRLMTAKAANYAGDLAPGTLDCLREINQGDQVLYDQARQLLGDRVQQMRQTLAQTYGPGDEAQVNRWLERHYADCYAIRNPNPVQDLDLTMDQPISGSGWQLREGEGDTLFRWTGPGSESTLDLPLAAGRDLTLRLKVVGGITPEVVDGLTLTVNDETVPLTKVCHLDTENTFLVIYQGTIPTTALESDRPFTRLRFQVPHTLSHQSLDPSNPDHRPVGIALNHLRLSPAVPLLAASDRPFLFPVDDDYWRETAQFVAKHCRATERIVAPLEFAEGFPQQVTSYPQMHDGTPLSLHQWVVVHKGQLQQLPVGVLRTVRHWKPVFANPVFVVLTSQLDWIALRDHPDVVSFRHDLRAYLQSKLSAVLGLGR
jgi:hypothetical protein